MKKIEKFQIWFGYVLESIFVFLCFCFASVIANRAHVLNNTDRLSLTNGSFNEQCANALVAMSILLLISWCCQFAISWLNNMPWKKMVQKILCSWNLVLSIVIIILSALTAGFFHALNSTNYEAIIALASIILGFTTISLLLFVPIWSSINHQINFRKTKTTELNGTSLDEYGKIIQPIFNQKEKEVKPQQKNSIFWHWSLPKSQATRDSDTVNSEKPTSDKRKFLKPKEKPDTELGVQKNLLTKTNGGELETNTLLTLTTVQPPKENKQRRKLVKQPEEGFSNTVSKPVEPTECQSVNNDKTALINDDAHQQATLTQQPESLLTVPSASEQNLPIVDSQQTPKKSTTPKLNLNESQNSELFLQWQSNAKVKEFSINLDDVDEML